MLNMGCRYPAQACTGMARRRLLRSARYVRGRHIMAPKSPLLHVMQQPLL